jgi:hypothetical protein
MSWQFSFMNTASFSPTHYVQVGTYEALIYRHAGCINPFPPFFPFPGLSTSPLFAKTLVLHHKPFREMRSVSIQYNLLSLPQ